jgi:spore maturation protein CgeB
MRLVIFGLAITSSWGNGHATLWRALVRALAERGHDVTFFERETPWYSAHRDLHAMPECKIVVYDEWPTQKAVREVERADAVIVTSYCPDARGATDLLRTSPGVRVFYDLDSPVTLARLDRGEDVEYLPDGGLQAFDLVLSFTGGAALEELRTRLQARRVAPLYGSVDIAAYAPVADGSAPDTALSHLGTYASDRQDALKCLFLDVARTRSVERLLLGGSLYPPHFAALPNIVHIPHVPPAAHPAFFAASWLTLNVTRASMARMGYCPSGRLFEAAACAAALVSDVWRGLEEFFVPGKEIIPVETTADVLDALAMPDRRKKEFGEAARQRVLTSHTARHRAAELERLLLLTAGSAEA